MSLEHAVLGFINYKPFSGYDQKKLFDRAVHHFWPTDQSRIYRTLSRLLERGWASMEVVAKGKPAQPQGVSDYRRGRALAVAMVLCSPWSAG